MCHGQFDAKLDDSRWKQAGRYSRVIPIATSERLAAMADVSNDGEVPGLWRMIDHAIGARERGMRFIGNWCSTKGNESGGHGPWLYRVTCG